MGRLLLLVALCLCWLQPLAAWDLRNDFSLASNANGAWSYGSTTTLGGFSIYTNNTFVSQHYLAEAGTSGLAGWTNNASPPIPYVAKNFTSQTYYQNWHPTDVLLHPRFSGIYTVARWTSPVAAPKLSIDALFRRLESATTNVSNCYVLLNGVVLDSSSLVTVNTTHAFNSFSPIAVGDVIDLVVGAAAADAGTGIVVDGTFNVVPEPTSFIVLGFITLALIISRKQR